MSNTLIFIAIIAILIALWAYTQIKLHKMKDEVDRIYDTEAELQKQLTNRVSEVKNLNLKFNDAQEKLHEKDKVIDGIRKEATELKNTNDFKLKKFSEEIEFFKKNKTQQIFLKFADGKQITLSNIIGIISEKDDVILTRKDKPELSYRATGFRYTKEGDRYEIGLIPSSISKGRGTVKYYPIEELNGN